MVDKIPLSFQIKSSMLSHKKLWLLCCTLTIVFAGCSNKKPVYPELYSRTIQNQIINSAQAMYPDQFRAIHRVILTLGGSDYVLNAYLSVNRVRKKISLVAQNDLGGTVFDVNFTENKEPQVNSNIKAIRPEWLKKTLLRDLRVLYLYEPQPLDKLLHDPAGIYILSSMQKGGIEQRAKFSRPKNFSGLFLHMGTVHYDNNKLIYRVKSGYGSAKHPSLPDSVVIEDTKMRYMAKINIQYFLP